MKQNVAQSVNTICQKISSINDPMETATHIVVRVNRFICVIIICETQLLTAKGG
jgi:hypothetical protein